MLAQLEETLMYENPEAVAAVFVETVTGSNGLIIPPAGYLPGLRKLCDKYGILMICDEVMAGLGRTGEYFAVDNWKARRRRCRAWPGMHSPTTRTLPRRLCPTSSPWPRALPRPICRWAPSP
jgi:adenosylmethionine-8-amino-7-oxononanoate aminotransferase